MKQDITLKLDDDGTAVVFTLEVSHSDQFDRITDYSKVFLIASSLKLHGAHRSQRLRLLGEISDTLAKRISTVFSVQTATVTVAIT